MALKLVKRTLNVAEESERGKSREEYLLACLREEQRDARFSDWERQFISSLSRQLAQGRKLTQKQKETLEKIWAK
jgi:hypothetical protein